MSDWEDDDNWGAAFDVPSSPLVIQPPSDDIHFGRGMKPMFQRENSSNDLKLMVDGKKCGKIIGRGGSKIRELEERSGARIKIVKEKVGSQVPVILSGNTQEKERARRLIEDILLQEHGSRQGIPGSFEGDNAQDESENSFSTRMSVEARHCGKIIGRSGTNIKHLESISGARLKILKNEAEGDNVPVLITGDASQRLYMKKLITEQLSHRNDFSNLDESMQSITKSTIYVNSSDCGKIIGRRGSKIKELEEDAGVRICINNSGESLQVPVIITGEKQNCEEAENSIKDLLGFDQVFDSSRSTDQNNTAVERQPGKFVKIGFIDWSTVNATCEEQTRKRWEGCTSIVKNFYIEDSAVSDMMPHEVEDWRKINFDLTVTDLSTGGEDPRRIMNPVLTFEQAFQHYPKILESIYEQRFEKPSPVQSQVWPLAMSGYDVIGIAQTGTGKTLAFLLPAFLHIDMQLMPREKRPGPSVLILTPTRELALQIEMEIKKYHYRGIRCVCVYGGGDRKRQVKLVTNGVEIVVATPGRFNDLLSSEIITLDSVTFLVLDEADRMLDMGFEPQIMKILIDIRPDRQTIMTSATWPEGVRRLGESYMTDPVQVTVGSLDLAAVGTVHQIVEIVDEEEKRKRLLDFIECMETNDKVLVFAGRKTTVDHLSTDLCLLNIICQSIHGGREQYDREQALDDFKLGRVRILIATDVASRGLDVSDVTHVFNYDYPRNTEEYVHRVGRTGRAGKSGTSITLVTREDWRSAKELIEILERADQVVPIELCEMAERYGKMKEKREMEGSYYKGRGRSHFRRF